MDSSGFDNCLKELYLPIDVFFLNLVVSNDTNERRKVRKKRP